MKRILISLSIILVSAGSGLLFSQKIYVSTTGNDNNTGSADLPVATLTAARDMARVMRKGGPVNQPIEIIASGGEYFMMQPLYLTSEDSGTEDSPLIFKSEKGTKALFRGGVEINGFEKINEKLWRAFIPNVAWYGYYFEQLYVNDKRATRARTPNDGFYLVRNVKETVLNNLPGHYSSLALEKIEIDTLAASGIKSFSKADYPDALVIFYHNWDVTRKHVTEFNRDSNYLLTVGNKMQPWNPINEKSRYYIENFRNALDAPGEWYLERSGYLYYIPEMGQTIENTKFVIPVLREFINIQGDQASGKKTGNINFEDLSFEIAAYNTPPDGNEPEQAAASVSATVTIDFADKIEFRHCNIAHTGSYAIWFRKGSSNCLVGECYLHDLGAGAVKIGETATGSDTVNIPNNIIVDNNIIRSCGHVFPCAVGIIIFNASDNRITHNEIADLRYTGISAGWVWGYAYSPSKRNIIEFNNIHHLGWGELSDMGGVYTLGASEGTTVSNNVVHHVFSFDYGGWGLYTDEGSFGITMENNLVYKCKNSGFHQHYGKENIIRNNIFAFNIIAQLQATRVEEHRSLYFTNNIIYYDSGTLFSSNWHKFNLLSDYNCYWDTRTREIDFNGSFNEWKKEGKDVHSIIADPLFVNPSAFDFRFRNLSVVKKIRFIPFDYSKAGVYGSEEWKKLAESDPEMERKFDERISSYLAGQ